MAKDTRDPDHPETPPEEARDTARMKAILTLVAAVAFAVSPFMSGPFTGFEGLPVLPAQPAGYAFAIWGAIYAWLVLSAGYGLFRRDTDAGWDATRWPLFLSMALGAGWIAVALRDPLVATVMIVAMWAGAVLALMRAPGRDTWWCAAPIGLYAGWLTAASWVAAGTVLAGYAGVEPIFASYVVLVGVIVVAAFLLTARPPVTYPAAVLWALVGVIVALFQNEAPGLELLRWAAIGATAGLASAAWRLARREG